MTESIVSDFELPGTDGSGIERYRLTDFTEDGPVVLMFYPFDFSPVCTDVFCRFRDAEFLTFTENVDVVGISRDSCYAHMRFIEEYDLPFPLLSDTEGQVIDEFGVAYEKWECHKSVSKRAIMTIDESHTVRYRWQTEDANNSPDLDELHESVLCLVDEGEDDS